jgi:hypothetical protein
MLQVVLYATTAYNTALSAYAMLASAATPEQHNRTPEDGRYMRD